MKLNENQLQNVVKMVIIEVLKKKRLTESNKKFTVEQLKRIIREVIEKEYWSDLHGPYEPWTDDFDSLDDIRFRRLQPHTWNMRRDDSRVKAYRDAWERRISPKGLTGKQDYSDEENPVLPGGGRRM